MQSSFPLCDPAVSGLHRKSTGGQEHKNISYVLYINLVSSAYCSRYLLYCSLFVLFQLGRNVLTLLVSQDSPIQHLPPHPDSKVNTTFPTSLSYIDKPQTKLSLQYLLSIPLFSEFRRVRFRDHTSILPCSWGDDGTFPILYVILSRYFLVQ